MRIWSSLLSSVPIILAAATPGHAEDNPLAPLAPLVGSCWHGQFAGQNRTDSRCFTLVYDGAHIIDRHRVESGDTIYEGHTIFSWNAEENRIDYVYFNSLGGVSMGSLETIENGFAFPDETYQAPDGSMQTIHSTWTIEQDGWQQNAHEGDNLIWQVNYHRRPLADYPALSAGE